MLEVVRIWNSDLDSSLNDPPPQLQQLALNFMATFLVVTLLNNNGHTVCRRLSFIHAVFICMGPLRSPF